MVSPPQEATTEVSSPRSPWAGPRSIALSLALHAFFAWLIFDSLSVDAVPLEEQQEQLEDLESQVVAVVELQPRVAGPIPAPSETTPAPLPLGDFSTPTANDQLALGRPDAGAEPAAAPQSQPAPVVAEPEIAEPAAPETAPEPTEADAPAEAAVEEASVQPELSQSEPTEADAPAEAAVEEPSVQPASSQTEPPAEAPEAEGTPGETATTPPSEAEPTLAEVPPTQAVPQDSAVASLPATTPEQASLREPPLAEPQEVDSLEPPVAQPEQTDATEAPPEDLSLAEPPPAVILQEEEAPIAQEIVPPQSEEEPPVELAALPPSTPPAEVPPETPVEEPAPSERDLTLETIETALVLDALSQEAPEEIEEPEIEEPGVPLAVPLRKPQREVTLPEPARPARQTAATPRQSNQTGTSQPRSSQGEANRGNSGTEGRSGSSLGTAGGTVASYFDLVANQLNRNKRCPDGSDFRRPVAEVIVRFQVDSEGWVISHRILQYSGSRQMDAEVADLLVRSSPLPPPPSGQGGLKMNLRLACRR